MARHKNVFLRCQVFTGINIHLKIISPLKPNNVIYRPKRTLKLCIT